MSNRAMDGSILVWFQPMPVRQCVEVGHQIGQVRFKSPPGDMSHRFLFHTFVIMERDQIFCPLVSIVFLDWLLLAAL